MATWNGWVTQLLQAGGYPVTPTNVQAMQGWAASEGGTAANNPLNTTWKVPGATPYNQNGGYPVLNYQNPNVGIQATVKTLNNGRYAPIVDLLKSGKYDLSQFGKAVQSSPWGTKQGQIGQWASGAASSPTSASKPLKTAPVAAQTPSVSPVAATRANLLGQALNLATHGAVQSNVFANMLGAVSSKGSVEPPKNTNSLPTGPNPTVDRALAVAHEQVGKPYVFGSGPDTSSFDCSDLIQYSYKQAGINLPRTTYEQIKVGTTVPWGHFMPGDLIFSNGGEHVVMYVGNGRVIAAPHTGTVVQYQPVSKFKNGFVTAKRVVKGGLNV